MRAGIAAAALLLSTVATAGVGTWTTNGPPGGGSLGVIADPLVPGNVYAGNLGGLFISTDNGATWKSAGFPGQVVSPLATGPPTTLYVSRVSTDGLVQYLEASPDDGLHWNILRQGNLLFEILVVDPSAATTLYAVATEVILFPLNMDTQHLLRSLDGGVTWSETGSDLGLNTRAATSLVADPSTPGTLYVATIPWRTFSPPGLFRSTDSGTTWVQIWTATLSTIVVDPTTPKTIYAGGLAGIVKSTDGGQTFRPMNNGLTNQQVNALCIDARRPSRIYAATAGGVFASSDAAASWQPLNDGLPSANVTGIAIDSTGNYLHATTSSSVFDYQFATACAPDAHTLCLDDGRFAVTADFQATPTGPSFPATAVPLTDNTGYFWFFDPSNVETVVKVLTGCPVNDEYWVFAGGLTDVGVEMKVTDTVTGAFKNYSNAFGTPFQPIQDSAAFQCP